MQASPVATALVETPSVSCTTHAARLRASGNFLWCGDEKFFIKGVSYGTFAPNGCGEPFPERARVARDFEMMRAGGFNTLRTYDMPPMWLLDLASEHDLRVLVGIQWAQHLTLADTRVGRHAIVQTVEDGVCACGQHPAVLAYCIGNEIPTQIVRWYGKRKTERLLGSLCDAAKTTDPDGLVTYANYPSSEYLELPFLDFHCFNVYLHGAREFRVYLARLQMLVGSQPLCISEYGLDALRHGETAQA
ncbi:MAG: glycosyl transferase, partial [Chloroflexi bacterium]|nr:glycosyl transferase [Chloroflexota bacterium]